MAKIETMKIRYSDHTRQGLAVKSVLNLSRPVGPGSRNELADVLLIQALFDLVLQKDSILAHDPFHISLRPAKVTGQFDVETQLMIIQYQLGSITSRLRTVVPDGTIHPAALSGRELRSSRKQMTIVQLNLDASMCAHKYGFDHVAAILDRNPMLRILIGQKNSLK